MKTRRVVWMRSAVVAVALTWVFFLVGAHCGLLQVQPHAAHPNHPLVTSLGAEFAVNVDHAHLSDNSTPPCPDRFATAVLPRSAISPIASVMVLTVTGITGLLTYLVVSVGRGPPVAVVSACVGQDLLTRFCLSRR